MISTQTKGIKVMGDKPKDVLAAIIKLNDSDKNMVTCVYCYTFKGVKR